MVQRRTVNGIGCCQLARFLARRDYNFVERQILFREQKYKLRHIVFDFDIERFCDVPEAMNQQYSLAAGNISQYEPSRLVGHCPQPIIRKRDGSKTHPLFTFAVQYFTCYCERLAEQTLCTDRAPYDNPNNISTHGFYNQIAKIASPAVCSNPQ